MQYDLVSDLHVDRWPEAPLDWAALKKSDLLVVAGDVSDTIEETVAELARMAAVYPQVVFVDGNHEHEADYKQIALDRSRLHAALAGYPNIHFLEKGPFIKNGIAIVGRCGWWDYAFGEPHIAKATCLHADQMKGVTAETQNAVMTVAAADATALVAEVTALQSRADITDILVVTHTLPRRELISWQVYPKRSEFAGCYGNRDMSNVLAADAHNKIRRWHFGHNHDSRDMVLDGVHYVSNPRGRASDFNRVSYTPQTFTMGPAAPAPTALPRLRPPSP